MLQPQKAKGRYDGVWASFWFCLAGAAAIFIPFMVVDKGLFIYAGDFNSQQISFWQYANDFIKEGGGQFSWATDLGSSFVNSYSFYMLGSPFFWFSLLFPSAWLPYLMCPLLCLKFAVSGAGAFVWLRRYTKSRNLTIVGACLYAFSGFTVYNVFFNHFLDVIALFPFLLWALDEAVLEKRRGPFAVLVALNLVNSYFFFAGQAVFLLLYFFIKLGSGEYKLKWGHFGWLFFEAVLGCVMGCALLLPAIVSLAGNPRTVDLSSGFGFLLYGRVQQYFAIFYSLFFPPDPCYLPNVFTDAVIRHTSMTAYLPLIGMCGVLAYLHSKKRTALRRLLFTCFVMAMVPVLNSSFYALNSSYYARWYYMPVLLMCLASVQALEDKEIDFEWGFKANLAISATFLVFGLVPAKDGDKWTIGVAQYASRFWVTVLQALVAALILWVIWDYWRHHPRFANRLLGAVLGFSVFYSVLHIAMGKFPQWEGDAGYKDQMYDAKTEVQLPEEGFYRIDTQDAPDNVGIWLDTSNLRFFNSTVSPSIMEFYPSIGVKRDVSSKPAEELEADELNVLRSFLGCRYLLSPLENAASTQESLADQPGWQRIVNQGAYAIWENENALPMGFAMDYYLPLDEYNSLDDSTQISLLLRAVMLDDEQVARWSPFIQELPDSLTGRMEDRFELDVADRKAAGVENVWTDASGFGGTISLDQARVVVFTVPYDEGFTATVNGVETQVEKVDNGMMAILCPAGDSEIVFSYATPLFREGCIASLAGWVIFAGYMGLVLYKKKKRRAAPQPVSIAMEVDREAEPADKGENP